MSAVSVDGEIAAVRAEYVSGEIDLDEFEALIERALRAEAAKPSPPSLASVDAMLKNVWVWDRDIAPVRQEPQADAWERESDRPSNRLPIRREPLPDWAKDAIDQELDRLTK